MLSVFNLAKIGIHPRHYAFHSYLQVYKKDLRSIAAETKNRDISSIGAPLAQMTSQAKMAAPRWPPGLQNGHQDSKMPWLRPSPVKGHDL